MEIGFSNLFLQYLQNIFILWSCVVHITLTCSQLYVAKFACSSFFCSSSDIEMNDVSRSDEAPHKAYLVSTIVLERDPMCFCYEL